MHPSFFLLICRAFQVALLVPSLAHFYGDLYVTWRDSLLIVDGSCSQSGPLCSPDGKTSCPKGDLGLQ